MSVYVSLKMLRWNKTGTRAVSGFGVYTLRPIKAGPHVLVTLSGVGTIRVCDNFQDAWGRAQLDYASRQRNLFDLFGITRKKANG